MRTQLPARRDPAHACGVRNESCAVCARAVCTRTYRQRPRRVRTKGPERRTALSGASKRYFSPFVTKRRAHSQATRIFKTSRFPSTSKAVTTDARLCAVRRDVRVTSARASMSAGLHSACAFSSSARGHCVRGSFFVPTACGVAGGAFFVFHGKALSSSALSSSALSSSALSSSALACHVAAFSVLVLLSASALF